MGLKIYSLTRGSLVVEYLGRVFNARFFLCSKTSRDLDSELQALGLSPELPVALIPVKLIENNLQLIQGVVHYFVNKELLTRIRHEGLLLAMLITGFKQLKDLLNSLREAYNETDKYLLVSATEVYNRPVNCIDYPLGDTDFSRSITGNVKNVAVILDLL
jgi:hypothetical protein